jgi:multiple sugar transport system substrate-binding protein
MSGSRARTISRRGLLTASTLGMVSTLAAACSQAAPPPPTTAPSAAPTTAAPTAAVTSVAPTTAAPTETPAAVARPSSGASGTIQFLNIGAIQDTISLFNKTVIPDFEKQNPKITVQMQAIDWAPSFQKISTAAAAGTAPDVFVMGGIFTDPLASKGALLQIDDYLGTWDGTKDIYPNVWSDSRYQGKTYAVPFHIEPQTIVYRQDFYSAAGVNAPETWDDLKAAAGKLVKKSGSTISVEGMDWNLTTNVSAQQCFINLLYQAGGDYFDSSGNPSFGSDPGHKALTYMVSFYKDGLSGTSFVRQGSGPEFVALGKAATGLVLNQDVAADKSGSPSTYDQIAAALPLKMDASSQRNGLNYINKLGIYAKTKSPDAAWAWLSYIMSPGVLAPWSESLLNFPSRKSVSESLKFIQDDPRMKVFSDAIQYTKPQTQHPAMFQIIKILNDNVLNALYQRVSVDDALKAMDSQVGAAIKG